MVFDHVSHWSYAQFSTGSEAALRTAYGILLLLQLVWTWPHARRFFSTERYGGYIESSGFLDRAHTPLTAYVVLALWSLSALGLAFGTFVLPAALINFALAHYFFVTLRWKSILRGMGAPGHMNYWIGALIAFLALGDTLAPAIPLRAVTVIAFRIDFALIMLAAGVYKFVAGYARGDGFERGLVNPWWGWWSKWLRAFPSRSPIFILLDHAAYAAEIICGIAFLIPAAAPYGAAVLGLSFLGIAGVIRLTFLAEMVAACCLLYIWPNTPVDAIFTRLLYPAHVAPINGPIANTIAFALTIMLAAYVAMLPFAYTCMIVNFYFRRRLAEPIQRFFDAWNRFFGLILWRVFTNDIISFYCDILERRKDGADQPIRASLRFNHVGEFICLASLFTTLKYYPKETALFHKRVLRYVRSLPVTESTVVFRYHRIEKGYAGFEYIPIAEFIVNPLTSEVEERVLDGRFNVRSSETGSPIHTAGRPGSYAPVSST